MDDTDDVVARWVRPGGQHVAQARTRVTARLRRLGVSVERLGDAEIMASELATNALRHGAGPVAVLAWPSDLGCVVVEVHDAGRTRPVLPSPIDPADVDAPAGSGWGLPMVTALARQRCGVAELPDGGKSVWFALPLSELFPPQPVLAGLVCARTWARSVLPAQGELRVRPQPSGLTAG
ncbi:hypothetical protein HDA32_005152 [Spinactinospora alkalitolerans]|uniref:Histidine kinase/HSP90-like ATPase domain-containing protein n=1 Tax=Spinactinospora alkalitolerans TaxID=687207 RepID=A0A852U3I5_9ACTN|nr:ATP-binding protein [Spinactinospora alkalitolerans]NYE50032.1 hypothetical protein [Spinactinospora alkalitolerans]